MGTSNGAPKERSIHIIALWIRYLLLAMTIYAFVHLISMKHSLHAVPDRLNELKLDLDLIGPAPKRMSVDVTWPDPVKTFPKDYPRYESLLSVIKRWNPDIADPPPTFNETLYHFNYSCPTERAVAAEFLEAEMPFKLYNVPEFDEASRKWTDEYLVRELGSSGQVERAETNHFMFWNSRAKKSTDFKKPTTILQMRFEKFLDMAHRSDASKLSSEEEHYYFTIGVPKYDKKTFIGQDLSLFSSKENNFFVRDTSKNKGIQCRFGMRCVFDFQFYVL